MEFLTSFNQREKAKQGYCIFQNDPIFKDGYSKERLVKKAKELIAAGWVLVYPGSIEDLGGLAHGSAGWCHPKEYREAKILSLAEFEKEFEE